MGGREKVFERLYEVGRGIEEKEIQVESVRDFIGIGTSVFLPAETQCLKTQEATFGKREPSRSM